MQDEQKTTGLIEAGRIFGYLDVQAEFDNENGNNVSMGSNVTIIGVIRIGDNGRV